MGGTQFLDLGTAHTLETELRAMMDSVDELNQESIKFNKHQNMVLKQYQEKTRWIQKRQLENQARSTRGEVRPILLIILFKMFSSVMTAICSFPFTRTPSLTRTSPRCSGPPWPPAG